MVGMLLGETRGFTYSFGSTYALAVLWKVGTRSYGASGWTCIMEASRADGVAMLGEAGACPRNDEA